MDKQTNIYKIIYTLVMFCFQIMYLLISYVLFSHIRRMNFATGTSVMGFTIKSLAEMSLLLVNILINLYPIISILAFSVFIWACITRNLHKRKVFYICFFLDHLAGSNRYMDKSQALCSCAAEFERIIRHMRRDVPIMKRVSNI